MASVRVGSVLDRTIRMTSMSDFAGPLMATDVIGGLGEVSLRPDLLWFGTPPAILNGVVAGAVCRFTSAKLFELGAGLFGVGAKVVRSGWFCLAIKESVRGCGLGFLNR